MSDHAAPTKRLTLRDLDAKKHAGEPIVMVTAFDFPSAQIVEEAGVDLVKIERGGTTVDRARALVNAGIPVVGHVGLTPQTATSLGGYRAQGRTAEAAIAVIDDALALQDAGVSLLVIEAVPSEVTAALAPLLRIPLIGIGAGADADGQVLVFHDLLGIYAGGAAKFVKRYADVRGVSIAGVAAYADEVRGGQYPAPEHGYGMPEGEAARLRDLLARR